MSEMTKADKLLASLTAGVTIFLNDLNSDKDDHSEERKTNSEFFRKSLSEAFVYLEVNFPGEIEEKHGDDEN